MDRTFTAPNFRVQRVVLVEVGTIALTLAARGITSVVRTSDRDIIPVIDGGVAYRCRQACDRRRGVTKET